MQKQTKRKIFRSIEEFDRYFFPEASEKNGENQEQVDPTSEATQIAEQVLSSLV
jgi:hypothetical protein